MANQPGIVRYPTPAILSDTVQIVDIQVPLSAAATLSLYTLSGNSRFYLTKIVVHDPTADVHTATLAFGSANTSANSLVAAQALTNLTAAGSTFVEQQVASGLAATPAAVLTGNDTVTVTVAGTPVAGAYVSIDLEGYYR